MYKLFNTTLALVFQFIPQETWTSPTRGADTTILTIPNVCLSLPTIDGYFQVVDDLGQL